LATIFTWAGWLLILGALAAIGAGAAGDYAQVHIPLGLQLNSALLQMSGSAAVAGALAILLGEAARAHFDHASAVRDLAAIERAKTGNEGH
jgi:hypothetical protein